MRRESADREPVYLLHQRAYRNSSQLLECMSLNHGRVALVAQGSRRPGTGSRAVLQPFVPLRLSWTRRGELGRVTGVDAPAPALALSGTRLLAGYYVNELLLRLTARDDANPAVFSSYSECLRALAEDSGVSRTLRLFEYRLLESLGFGLQLGIDVASNEPIRPDKRYAFDMDSGPRLAAGDRGYRGLELISLREERLDTDDAVRAARQLLADALAAQLGPRQLKSREVLQAIAARGLSL